MAPDLSHRRQLKGEKKISCLSKEFPIFGITNNKKRNNR